MSRKPKTRNYRRTKETLPPATTIRIESGLLADLVVASESVSGVSPMTHRQAVEYAGRALIELVERDRKSG